MLLKVLIFLVLPAGYLLSQDCDNLKKHFKSANNNFLDCIIDHTEIATFCTDCILQYTSTLTSYNNLVTGFNFTNNTVPCRSRFIDNNQLDLFQKILANSKQLWEIGVCSDCYAASCDFSNYIEDNCSHSDHTIQFNQRHDATESCMNTTPRNLTCADCSEKYGNLSSFYNDIRTKTGDKFCFAIKDQMNKTQIRWIGLQCCEDRQSSMLDFFALSGSSIFVSILFYFSIYLFALRKERIQYIPDDLMPVNHEDHDQSSGPTMNINYEEPSTSELSLGNESIMVKFISESDESDDEPLLVGNPNLIQI